VARGAERVRIPDKNRVAGLKVVRFSAVPPDGMMEETMGRKRKATGPQFTQEQKADAVRLLERGDVSAEQIAEGLGVSARSLRRWRIDLEESEAATPLTKEERAELKRLRKRVEVQEQEIEILKKARTFMAERRS
jgi:transposase-like protein